MRPLLLIPLFALAAPLAAQSRSIAPASSALFRAPALVEMEVPGYTLPVTVLAPVAEDGGMKWWQGGVIGAGIGGAVGAITTFALSNRTTCADCSSDDGGAGLAYLAGVGSGAVLGFFIGGSLAQSR